MNANVCDAVAGCIHEALPNAPSSKSSAGSQVKSTDKIRTAFTAKATRVIDSESVEDLTDDKHKLRIRLNGVDCSGHGKPIGNNARDSVTSVRRRRRGTIGTQGQDICG